MVRNQSLENLCAVLVIGASRGVGAATVRTLARNDVSSIGTFNTRETHSNRLMESLIEAPGGVDFIQLDICDPVSLQNAYEHFERKKLTFQSVVLCASGGMEPRKPDNYADAINSVAPENVAKTFTPLIRENGFFIFVTSHEAHFFGEKPVYEPYEKIARSKKAGELTLVGMSSFFQDRGVLLRVVSADIIEDSTTAKLLRLKDPGLIDRRKADCGRLPMSEDVAEAIFDIIVSDGTDQISTHYVFEPDRYYKPNKFERGANEFS